MFTGVNPQGVRVVSWKVPNDVEQAHDYLWRIHTQTPAQGEIVIFNRSHYEDVLVVRVNQLVAEARWRKRYRHINEFERMLTDEGTVIVKIHLQISKDEQRERFEERLADPMKRWKFQPRRPRTREDWDDYMAAYEDALTETSTAWAPWCVVPGDREWVRNTAVAQLLIRTIEDLKPAFPPGEQGIGNLKIASSPPRVGVVPDTTRVPLRAVMSVCPRRPVGQPCRDHPHLLAALRDELDVLSPKDGCSPSGQCGCCTVLIDGKAQVS